MKPVYYLLILVTLVTFTSSCNKLSYRKTKSGLVYKIIPSDNKDSLLKQGDWVKIYFIQKRNGDTVIQSNYDRMPFYQKLMFDPNRKYDPSEIFPQMKKGDSAVVVMYVDSLLSKQLTNQLPPYLKKGDKLTLYFKIADVFYSDSLQREDARVEYEKDLPRQQKEREEQIARMEKELQAKKEKELQEAESSGEADKQRKEMEEYLAARHINAQKTGKGTYVQITQQGTGPKAEVDKYITVKYSGRTLDTDSTFDAGSYSFQLGKGKVIDGWDEGLQLFNEGGKGVLYIPGFRAYGKNPPPNAPFKSYQAMIFDVELTSVSDSMPAPPDRQLEIK